MGQLHAVTGEFLDKESERRFRAAVLLKMQKDTRPALIIAALLFAMFGISDYNFVGQSPVFYLLLATRVVIAAGCLLLAALVSTSPALWTRPWVYSVAPFLTASGTILIVALRPQTLPTLLTSVVVMVMFFYLFFPNFLWGMISSSLYLTAGFLFGAWYWARLGPAGVVTYSLLLILPNIAGYVVALRLARLQREHFVLATKLRHMAHTDELTGLSNRRDFFERAEAALMMARRQGHPFSLCMIDIDHFKSINDTLGHGGGDRVLRAVARTCLAALREGEPFGRLGGEEFAAAMPGSDLQQARRTAERLREKVAELRFNGEFSGRHVTVTIGVAEVRPQEAELEPALKRADAALYRGKRSGRDIVLADT